jgi:hypothetical protein
MEDGKNGDRDHIHRILSLDGGGLYGLTSALWLRQLCEQDPEFLRTGDVQLFAGCSAGALNSLLLAKEPEPREFVLAGGLENFWRQPGTFSNTNPVTAFWSLFQVTAWFGTADFLQLLQALFGDMTLGDLPNRVLITTFNWTGERNACATMPRPPAGSPPCDPWSPWTGTPADVMASSVPDAHWWRPKFFKNFPDRELDRRCRIVDVAYAATAPPGMRAILDGLGDGGTFNACPCADAVAAVVAEERDKQHWSDNQPVGDLLDRLHLLSLGVGAKRSAYWLRYFDYSFTQFSLYPTNPLAANWYPPGVSVGLDGPTEEAIYISRQLLGANFHRLNPGLLEVPTLAACIWARSPQIRESLIQQIYAAVQTPVSRQAVRDALDFLKNRWRQEAYYKSDAKSAVELGGSAKS